jgi:hypothetical protein
MKIEELEDINLKELIDNKIYEEEEEFYEDSYSIFSYPYFIKDNYEYKFRITINDTTLVLDEIKTKELDIDNDDVIILSKIYSGDLEESLELINNKLDLRNKKNILDMNNSIVNYEIDDNNFKEIVEKNKNIVLSDLYLQIIE